LRLRDLLIQTGEEANAAGDRYLPERLEDFMKPGWRDKRHSD
jgi:hypothetical protein